MIDLNQTFLMNVVILIALVGAIYRFGKWQGKVEQLLTTLTQKDTKHEQRLEALEDNKEKAKCSRSSMGRKPRSAELA